MKKILALSILSAMLLSAVSCSDNKSDPADTSAVTTAATEEPEVKPTPISLDEVNDVIASAKEEYAAATELTLADGTVISAETKDPGITKESVENGEATKAQITDYAIYMANIRRIVCDRLISFFPEDNRIYFDENSELDAELLFLDPASDGFNTSGDAFAKMISEDNDDDVVTDYIMVQNGSAVLFDAETNEAVLLCPNDAENAILAAVAVKHNSDTVTEEVE